MSDISEYLIEKAAGGGRQGPYVTKQVKVRLESTFVRDENGNALAVTAQLTNAETGEMVYGLSSPRKDNGVIPMVSTGMRVREEVERQHYEVLEEES